MADVDPAARPAPPPDDENTPEYREWLAAAYDTDVYEQWHKPFEDLANADRNQGEKPRAERLEKVRADWYKEPVMKTGGNPGYFDVNQRTEAFMRSRAMHFARTNRCSLT